MFVKEIQNYNWNNIHAQILDVHQTDVERVLLKDKYSDYNLDDFAALISPAAVPFLEGMRRRRRSLP